MGRGSLRRRSLAAVLAAGALVVGTALDALAQATDTTTTSSPPQDTTATTDPLSGIFAPPPSTQPADPSTTETTAPPDGQPAPATPAAEPAPAAPAAPGEGEGDGGHDAVASAGRNISAEAQSIIDSIARTAPGDNTPLVDGAAQLIAAGVPQDEAIRAVFGRFPVLGPTRWSDDWYYPRWTGTQFRFHQGLDMFAPYGTPVAAPVDGIARVGSNALGGLTVKVVEPDGTYWYLAHLSGIAEGLVDGQPVTTGQVVGYVGTSGNAAGTPPHLHFGVYPQGGSAAPPKPLVDGWVADGAARVPELLAQVGGVAASATTPAIGTALRATGTAVGPPTASTPSRSELLWASAANPTGGAVHLADAAAAAAADRLDWDQRAAAKEAMDLAWAAAVDRANRLLAPLTNPLLAPR
jgi:murein DD-endopeptidase MepM/ murein hydrolase activator NlpD